MELSYTIQHRTVPISSFLSSSLFRHCLLEGRGNQMPSSLPPSHSCFIWTFTGREHFNEQLITAKFTSHITYEMSSPTSNRTGLFSAECRSSFSSSCTVPRCCIASWWEELVEFSPWRRGNDESRTAFITCHKTVFLLSQCIHWLLVNAGTDSWLP